MKRTKRSFIVVLILALMLSLIPTTSFAAPSPVIGSVTVTVTNATYAGAPADRQGEFLRETVELTEDMTAGDAIKKACLAAGLEVTGIDDAGYITSVGGLGANPEAPFSSGWFMAINNWFTDIGVTASLEDGDWISIEYTNQKDWTTFGLDIGGIYGDYTKTLKSISFNKGKLSPAFSAETQEYTLTVPAGTTKLLATPLAYNRNFMVKTFIGETEYGLFDEIPVTAGSKVTFVCGDPTWPSMNKPDSIEAETYTFNIAYEAALDDSPKTGDSTMLLALVLLFSLATIGMGLTVRRRTN